MRVTSSLQIKNDIYQVVLSYKDDKGKRKQKWFSTKLRTRGNKKQAMAIAEELRADFEKKLNMNITEINKQISNTNILFIDFIKNWLEIVRQNIEPSTYTSYNQLISARMTKYFTDNPIKLVNMTPIIIQNYYTHLLAQGLSGNTVIHHHALIRKSLDYAYKMNIIDSNPADKVQRPKKEQYIGSFYNESELNTLFEKSKGDPMELIILVAAFYGLRRSEVLGLKWNAFDFENKTITIKHTVVIVKLDGKREVIGKDRTKNKSSYRSLPLIDEIATKLLELKEKQKEYEKTFGNTYIKDFKEYVFVNPHGKLIKPDYVSEHFKILLKKKGLRHIRFHDLRHSCASLLVAKGVPMKAIQEWLGHSNFSTTANTYAHLDSNSKLLSAQALNDSLNTKNGNETQAILTS